MRKDLHILCITRTRPNKVGKGHLYGLCKNFMCDACIYMLSYTIQQCAAVLNNVSKQQLLYALEASVLDI